MSRCTAAAAGLVLLALCACAPAAADPTISQYQLPSGDGAPLGIASGGEGNLWVTLSGGGRSLERVTLSGALSNYAIHGQATPLSLTTGAEGYLWFTASGGHNVLGSLDPLTGAIQEVQLSNNANATGLTRGPEGAIWFLLSGGSGAELARLDPPSEEVHEYAIPNSGSQPSELTFGPEGAIYFTETNSPAAIGRFVPATGAFVQFSGLPQNSRPTGITTGAEGDVWFTEAGQPGAIGRIVPATGELTQFSSGLGTGIPGQIAPGSDGNLYFTEEKPAAIGEITPAGTISQYTQGMPLNGDPLAITAGPDGNMWFTEQASSPDIARLTLAPSVADPAGAASGPASATLSARVGANAQPTSYYFEYGTTSAGGSKSAEASAGEGDSPASVSTAVTGLAPSTTYYFKVIASNASGSTVGGEGSFSTPAAPQAVPQLGRSAAVVPLSGSVLVRPPRAKRFERLGKARVVPVGSLIDVEHGSVRVLTALAKHGATQALHVWDGEFVLAQSRRGNGMTRLLVHGGQQSCARTAAAHTAKKRTARVRLWAEDNHGRYSTYGANSVATVLGTKWETIESCAGTRTVVLRGRVRVRDLHTHRTVVVGAGHSYLARP